MSTGSIVLRQHIFSLVEVYVDLQIMKIYLLKIFSLFSKSISQMFVQILFLSWLLALLDMWKAGGILVWPLSLLRKSK